MIDVSYSFAYVAMRQIAIHISREDRVVPILSHYSGKHIKSVRKREVEDAEEDGWARIYRERPYI